MSYLATLGLIIIRGRAMQPVVVEKHCYECDGRLELIAIGNGNGRIALHIYNQNDVRTCPFGG